MREHYRERLMSAFRYRLSGQGADTRRFTEESERRVFASCEKIASRHIVGRKGSPRPLPAMKYGMAYPTPLFR